MFGRHRAYKLQPQDVEAIVAEITQETVEDYLADIEQAVIADFGGDALEEVLKIARADMRPFVTNSQRTQQFLREKFGRHMKDITASTRREVSKALNEGIALGEDYTGLAKILDTKFKHIGQVRKDIIATTEVGAAANFAIDEGYRQSGLVSKRRWVTTFLRSRPTHMELSGDERGMDESFTVNSVNGLASAMYPGDFNVAAEDINCRCRTVAAKFTSGETTEDVTLSRDKETGELTRGGKPIIPTTPEPIPVPKPRPAPEPTTTGVMENITEDGLLSGDSEFNKRFMSDSSFRRNWDETYGKNNTTLDFITEQNGFDGLPTIVDKIQPKIGDEVVFRGVQNATQTAQFRTGKLFNGRGVYGDGTYAAIEGNEALSYGRSPMTMVIPKKARRISIEKIEEQMENIRKRAAAAVLDATDAAGKRAAKMSEFVIKKVTRDPGEYAALLGYDVIDAAGPRYRNILNRSILKVHSQDGIFE